MDRYIFEKGQYPNEIIVDDREFSSDDEAYSHAKAIGAEYAWAVAGDRNPYTVYPRRDRRD